MKRSLLIIPLILTGCTKVEKPKSSVQDFKMSAALILKVTKKLSQETDGKTLKKASISLQQSRLVACTNVQNECSQYGKFVTEAINIGDDGVISPDEKQRLTKKYIELREALVESEGVLKKQWGDYARSMKAE